MRLTSCLAAALMLCGASTAMAQSANLTPAQLQQLKQIGQSYASTTYTLKADETCELLTNGQKSALETFNEQVRQEVRRLGLSEDFKRADQSLLASDEWKTCLVRAQHPDQWERIDAGRILADAIIAAPNKTGDREALEACMVPFKRFSLTPLGWSFAYSQIALKYEDRPDKPQFEQMRVFFAEQVDRECKSGRSNYLRPAYENLLQAEAIRLYFERNNKQKRVYTKLGRRLLNDKQFDAVELGLWRSRKSYYDGFDVTAYRSTGRHNGKGNWASLYVKSAGTFGSRGMLYFRNDGRVEAKVSTKVDAFKFVDSNGRSYDFTHTVKDDEIVFGIQTFELSADQTRAFLSGASDRSFEIHYGKRGNWKRYHGLQERPASHSLASLLETKRWATVPYGRHFEKDDS